MDESNRLEKIGMPDNYDRVLFNELYKSTKKLINKLVFDIDARKFGVDNEEIRSWFEVKFIYVFSRYYGDPKIKGLIINALRTYKQKIIKNSYQKKNKVHQERVDINDLFDYSEILVDEPYKEDERLGVLKDYLRARLSPDAYCIFEIDLNPPPYILYILSDSDKEKIPKCPTELVAEYLGIDNISYVEKCRKEIKSAMAQAKEYFQLYPITS